MSNKKTHDEYLIEVGINAADIEVVEEYVNAKTKILHRCIKHDVYWKALPSNILKGKGCCMCKSEKMRNKFTKSHDEYVSQVAHINPNIEVLETYIDSDTPIMHLCRTHNVQWKAFPGNILRGYGCQECGKDKIQDKRRKDHVEYVNELMVKNPSTEVIGQYIDSKTKIMHRCTIHDVYWEINPANALRGDGCPKCHHERIGVANRKTKEQYVSELNNINPDIILIGDYINSSTPALHKCTAHNIEWMAYPCNVLNGCGCIKCRTDKISSINRKSHQSYVDEIKAKNPNIVVIDDYVSSKTPILHKCLQHNYEWVTSPISILQGHGCPMCASEKASKKLRKTHEQYEEDIKIANPNIVAVGMYVDANTPILHRCLIDGNEWYISPSNVLSGYGCPQCNESKGERVIRQWLEKHNIDYEFQKRFQDCRDKKPLPFDFYLPEYNAVIEYNGSQHYIASDYFGGDDALAYTKRHDKIKEDYCTQNDIGFLCIPYFRNIDIELNNFLFN